MSIVDVHSFPPIENPRPGSSPPKKFRVGDEHPDIVWENDQLIDENMDQIEEGINEDNQNGAAVEEEEEEVNQNINWGDGANEVVNNDVMLADAQLPEADVNVNIFEWIPVSVLVSLYFNWHWIIKRIFLQLERDYKKNQQVFTDNLKVGWSMRVSFVEQLRYKRVEVG